MAKKKTKTKKKVKKKATRKPKPKPEVVIEVTKGVPLDVEVEVPEIDHNDPYYLRYAASTYYITDPSLPTLQVMSETEPFIDIGLSTLQMWSRADRWSQRRKEWIEKFQVSIAERIMTERVRNMQGMLRSNKDHLAQLEILLPSAEPSSYEGMSGARMKLIDQIERQEEAIESRVSTTVGQVGTPGVTHQIKPDLNMEEARAAAMAIIQVRREKIREDLDAAAREEPEPQRKRKPPKRG